MNLVYPEADWEEASVAETSIDFGSWQRFLDQQRPVGSRLLGESHPMGKWGTVVTYNGRLLHRWGNSEYLYQSASVGKAFTKLVLQVALDKGVIESLDDPVHDYWIGDGRKADGRDQGSLSHPHKYLNAKNHIQLTFRHLAGMRGGFLVTNGSTWKGDPFYDNYAMEPPGEERVYSSGGMWRLTQALTYLFQEDLKSVLDKHVFRKMHIDSEDWYWLSGLHLCEDRPAPTSKAKCFYPEMPGYGAFVDPPYWFDTEAGRQWCVGGGGWAGMTPLDLARVGLLVAMRGVWSGERLVSDTNLLNGHAGGNGSDLDGWRTSDGASISWAQVTTSGVSKKILKEMTG